MIQYIDTGRVRATNSRRKILRIRIGSYPLTACWKWNGGIPLSRMIYHCNAWPTNTRLWYRVREPRHTRCT